MRRELNEEISFAASQFTKERDYWLKQLSGDIIKSSFPRDYPGNDPDKYQLIPVEFHFSGKPLSRIMKISGGSHPKLFMILATALAVLLHKYTGNTDIIIGAPIFKPDTEEDFINTVLALKNRVDSHMTFKEILLQVRQTVIEATENANYPIEKLLYQLNMPYQGNNFPLFDVAILLENVHSKKHILFTYPNIVFSFCQGDEKLAAEVMYNLFIYKKNTLQHIISQYKMLLEKAIFNIDLKLSHIDLLHEGEKQSLLFDFNQTTSQYPSNKTLHQLFEDQVEKSPDSIAVIAPAPGDMRQAFTYRQLNNKSNQLARLLRQKGVKANQMVAIMTDCSIETITAILGVLKAGGAYLPIDPDQPWDRTLAILKDCQPSIFLSKTSLPNRFFEFYQKIQGKGNLVTTGCRPAINKSQWNALPFPNRSLVDYEKYGDFIGHASVKNSISLQATRGCPYHCIYCHKIWPNTHVFRSPQSIFDEVKLLYELGIKKFTFIDDIFNLDKQNSMKFFKLIINNGLKVHFFFPNGLRGDILTRDYIELMVEAGTIGMALALETASPRLQKMIHKNLDLKKFHENIEYILKKHPEVILELNIMHGFPTETKDEALMTLNFVKQLQWVHFPYLNILRIFPNTEIEKLARANGISRELITRSENLAYNELPGTLPFPPGFTRQYQSELLNEYFLSKERLLRVLPRQMKVLTQDEMVQKYNSYLPVDIKSFSQLLNFFGISRDELGDHCFIKEDTSIVPNLNIKMRGRFPQKIPSEKAFRILLLDLSQYFTTDSQLLYDVLEPPLGLICLLTYLDQKFGNQIKGKIAKSRVDFENFQELKNLINDFNPDLIGIRTLTLYREFFHQAVTLIKNWRKDVPIIAGGPYASSDYQTLLQDRSIDMVVLGEGEITFGEIIENTLKNGGKLPDQGVLMKIPGIAFLETGKLPNENNPGILLIDQLSNVLPNEPTKYLPPTPQSSDLAYSIYTSGSTGKPKGVLLEHQSVVNYVYWAAKNYVKNEPVNFPFYTSPAFDLTVTSIFTPLITGNKIIIYGDKNKGTEIEKIVDENQCQAVKITPAHLKLVRNKQKKNTSIKRLIVGGEELETDLAADIHKNFNSQIEIINEYGPTEAAVGCMIHRFFPMRDKGASVPIGLPADNTRIYILSQNKKPVPIGMKGELYVCGEGVARGYLNDPELTAEKFKRAINLSPNDQWSMTNDRFYKTGDFARWSPDGHIEFLGRQDNQMKLRGYRVELGEIKEQLLKHDKIKEAVIKKREDQEGEPYLCAYYVMGDADEVHTEINTAEIRAFLMERLPGYMIPNYFVRLDHMPLTIQGKVDAAALPKPDMNTLLAESSYEAPRSETERKLVKIWAEVLDIPEEKMGINYDFFEMGGDSMNAIKLISIASAENIHFYLKDVLQYKTIKKIIENVDLNKKREIHFEKETIEEAPITPIQKWFFQLENPYPHFWNMPFLYELDEKADIRILEKALRKTIEHHDSLRINFIKENGEWKQVLTKITDINFSIEHIKIDDKNLQEQNKNMMDKIYEIQNSFNLHKGLLLKVAVFDLGKAGRRLFIVIHHLICDVVSGRIFFEDLINSYVQYAQNKAVTFKSKTTPFLEWSEKIHTEINPEDIDISYWQEIKQNQVDYLVKKNVKNNLVAHQQNAYLYLNETQTKILMQRVTRKYNITFEELLLSTLIISLHNVMKINNVLLEIESHGREELFEDVDLSRTIGWFTNKFPILLKYSGDIKGTLAKTKETLKRIPLRGIHYNLAKYIFNREDVPDLDCQVGFNYQGDFRLEKQTQKSYEKLLKPYNKSLIRTIHLKNQRPFIFEMLTFTQKSQLLVLFIYNRKHLKPRLIKRFREDFLSVLKKMTEKDF